MSVALLRLWLVVASLLAGATAQTSGPTDDERLEQLLTEACARLHRDGALRSCAELLAAPAPTEPVARPAVALRREPLAGPDLHDEVAPGVCLVGHYYLCTECEQWHFGAASGFWVTADGVVATCAHVLPADDGMREAFLVAADTTGQVWPVQRVLANDTASDLCLLATKARHRTPLPLRPDVRVGERVACLSHPDHQFGFYSEGVVARHFLRRDPPDAAAQAWLHVTCDFARGSSGAPVVDACGNVVAIASSTSTVVHDEAAAVVDTQMVLKTAAPAPALLALFAAPVAPPGGRDAR